VNVEEVSMPGQDQSGIQFWPCTINALVQCPRRHSGISTQPVPGSRARGLRERSGVPSGAFRSGVFRPRTALSPEKPTI
jgi:hypothetical protein